MSDPPPVTLDQHQQVIATLDARRRDPRQRRRDLAWAIARETRKRDHLTAIGWTACAVGLDRRIQALRQRHRRLVLETARPLADSVT